MALLEVVQHAMAGRRVKMGRIRPPQRGMDVRPMSAVATLPPAPLTFDWSTSAPKTMAQMFLNNAQGDCCIAGKARIKGVSTGAATGHEVVLTDAAVEAMYSQDGGYVPGDPSTDQGCNEQVCLTDAVANGVPIGGTKYFDWVAVDPASVTTYTAMLYRFGNLYYGLELVSEWADDFTPGMLWDTGTPNENYGHCVPGVARVALPGGGYATKVATWASYALLTDAASKDVVGAAGGELYCILSPDWYNPAGYSPLGFHFTVDAALWAQVTGHAVPASPFPAPGPTPIPPGGVVLTLSGPLAAGRYTLTKAP
jgi:hypothetical protein